MRAELIRHPDFPCDAVRAIEVDVERPEPRRLLVRYRLSGVTNDFVSPPVSGERQDELWRHTCLEAFVQADGDPGYREFNVSPGGAWAAYRFDAYRQGMANAEIGPPDVFLTGPGGYEIHWLTIWDLDLPADIAWRVGVSAVIEEASGRISYWAVRHPAGRPDFHHADGFALELPAPSAS
jgi:hypothetical protein